MARADEAIEEHLRRGRLQNKESRPRGVPVESGAMRAKPFKQATTTAFPPMVSNEYVAEALARQAAARPARTPPNAMPVTPTLPRVPKPHRRRPRRASGK